MSPWQLMLLPFLECLVLVGIHSYLGIHVIKRQVIFVDLALAQIAALGTLVAFVLGLQPQTAGSYVFSLLFTFLGAAVFSLTRLRREHIPQEAVIGIVYAFAAAVAILVIDRAPHGAEHIKEVLTGNILWVSWQTVVFAAVTYAAVGVFHYVFRARFLLISRDPAAAFAQGVRVRLWDFLFYMSFGLVITISVNTAGVLLVFVFLVVPAIMAISITDRLVYQLLIGWGMGTAVSFFGLLGSYVYDLPTGPMVVAVYGIALLLVALLIYVIRASRRGRALLHLGAGGACVALAVFAFAGLASLFREADTSGGSHDRPAVAAASAMTGDGVAAWLEELSGLDVTQRQEALRSIRDAARLVPAIAAAGDEELRTALALRLHELDPVSGRRHLLDEMRLGELPLFRGEALQALSGASGQTFGYDPMSAPDTPANREALARWEAWLRGAAQ
jgi:zinc/manganese transport system permease protein